MYPFEFHEEVEITGEKWTVEKGTEYTVEIKKTNYHIYYFQIVYIAFG
jgi:hypothetical protein